MTAVGPYDPLAGAGIKDNPDKSRFELVVDGALAVVEYRRMGKTLIAYTHTEVADELAGRGIGTRMAKAALEYARTNGLEVLPFCPFVRAYIQRHTEYMDLVSSRYKGFDTK